MLSGESRKGLSTWFSIGDKHAVAELSPPPLLLTRRQGAVVSL
jgi:hypothetical protein